VVRDVTLDGRKVAQEDLGERVDLGFVSGAARDEDGCAVPCFATVSRDLWTEGSWRRA